MLVAIALNLDTKQPGGGAQISKLEVRFEVVLDPLDGLLGLASNGDIIHKDWDDEAHSISQVHPDTVLTAESLKAELAQH